MKWLCEIMRKTYFDKAFGAVLVSALLFSGSLEAQDAEKNRNGEAYRAIELNAETDGYWVQSGNDHIAFSSQNIITSINDFGHISRASAWVDVLDRDGNPEALAGAYSGHGPRAFYYVEPAQNFIPSKSVLKQNVWSALNLPAGAADWVTFENKLGGYKIDAEAGRFDATLASGVKLTGEFANGRVAGVAILGAMQGSFEGYCGTQNGRAACYGAFAGASEASAFSGVWR